MAVIALGAIVGMILSVVVLATGDSDDDDTRTAGPPITGDVVVTRWSDLQVSADRRAVSVVAADPTVGVCTEPLGLNLEVRPGLVVVQPVFERQRDVACEQACDRIPLSVELEEPLADDVTFVASPQAVPTCDEGITLDE